MATWHRGNLKLAVRSLQVSKARSFMTMLGFIIGVMAVVCVVCIGQGIKQQIGQQINHFGRDLITVRAGSDLSGGSQRLFTSGLPTAPSSLLTTADLKTVQRVPGVAEAVPLSLVEGSARGDHQVTTPLVIATSQVLPDVLNQPLAYGAFFNPADTADEVVLGPNIARQLFDDDVPLGQTLTYRGKAFVVEGIFSQFDSAPFSLVADFNNAIFLPFQDAQQLSGSTLGMYQILVKPTNASQVEQTAARIRTALGQSHGGAQDTSVLTQSDSLAASVEIVHLLSLLIFGAAAIALLVGGVGIMNVLFLSVTERMHEIGIRKAIGATNRQILRQFLMEAFVVSITGAIVGVLLSMATVGLLRLFTSLQPVLVWQVLVLAPLMAVVVGVIFGTAPALKAARKDPIDALRHE